MPPLKIHIQLDNHRRRDMEGTIVTECVKTQNEVNENSFEARVVGDATKESRDDTMKQDNATSEMPKKVEEDGG